MGRKDYLRVQLPVWIKVRTMDNDTTWSRIVNVDVVPKPPQRQNGAGGGGSADSGGDGDVEPGLHAGDDITTESSTGCDDVGLHSSMQPFNYTATTPPTNDTLRVKSISDPDGAALFCVVVISVYAISIVLFMLTIVKRKAGAKLDDDATNDVTDYLMKVPDLKDKSARESFKKLKVSIISELRRQDSIGSGSILIPEGYTSSRESVVISSPSTPSLSPSRRSRSPGAATAGLLMAANSMLSSALTNADSGLPSADEDPNTPPGSSFASICNTPSPSSPNPYYNPGSPGSIMSLPGNGSGNITPRSTVRFTFPDVPYHSADPPQRNTEGKPSPKSPGASTTTSTTTVVKMRQVVRKQSNPDRAKRSSTSRPCVVIPGAREDAKTEDDEKTPLTIPKLVISSC